jgi:hypothetical protein
MRVGCENGDCPRAAFCKGLCRACYMCLRRNGSTVRKKPECGTRYEDPEDAVMEALIAAKEAKNKQRAHRRFLMATLRYRRKRNTVKNSPQHSP